MVTGRTGVAVTVKAAQAAGVQVHLLEGNVRTVTKAVKET